MIDHLRLRREKRSPNENAWHTVRIGTIAAIAVLVILHKLIAFGG